MRGVRTGEFNQLIDRERQREQGGTNEADAAQVCEEAAGRYEDQNTSKALNKVQRHILGQVFMCTQINCMY